MKKKTSAEKDAHDVFIRMMSLLEQARPHRPATNAMHDDKFSHATLKRYRSLKLKLELADLLTELQAKRRRLSRLAVPEQIFRGSGGDLNDRATDRPTDDRSR